MPVVNPSTLSHKEHALRENNVYSLYKISDVDSESSNDIFKTNVSQNNDNKDTDKTNISKGHRRVVGKDILMDYYKRGMFNGCLNYWLI